MEIYLIRHGNINRNGTCDDYFYPLTDKGHSQAKESSLFVKENVYDQDKNNLLVSSNTIRTIQTSMYFSDALHLKINLVDNVHELDMGYNECKPKNSWIYVDENNCFVSRDGMSYEQKFKTRHYMGESPYDVYMRIKVLENLIYSSDCDCIYIVGHGTTLRLLTMRLLKKDCKWFYDEMLPNYCSVRKLTLTNHVEDNDYIWR